MIERALISVVGARGLNSVVDSALYSIKVDVLEWCLYDYEDIITEKTLENSNNYQYVKIKKR